MERKNTTQQRLIIGPWNHGAMRGRGQTWVGDVDFGPAAQWGDARYNEERLRWFGRWLNDVPTGVEDDPPVSIFVMGDAQSRWRMSVAGSVPCLVWLGGRGPDDRERILG
jgi:uncharacterized protein